MLLPCPRGRSTRRAEAGRGAEEMVGSVGQTGHYKQELSEFAWMGSGRVRRAQDSPRSPPDGQSPGLQVSRCTDDVDPGVGEETAYT